VIVVSGAQVIAALTRAGFARRSQKGSHVKLERDGRVVIVPLHDELRPGTLASVLRQAGWTQEDLRKAL
jgi:predicted RNA binding protein YcfA (HicA-like mRNA interferase family)